MTYLTERCSFCRTRTTAAVDYLLIERCSFCHAPAGHPCLTVLYEEHVEHGNGKIHERPHAVRLPKLFETRDGLIVCELHFAEAFMVMTPPYRREPRGAEGDGGPLQMDWVSRSILKPHCGMCNQTFSPGRTCAHCETPLHPLWPAVYGSNECAFRDL